MEMATKLQNLLINKTPFKFNSLETKSSTLFETIAIFNNLPQNLEYHQQRVDKTFKEYFKNNSSINLQKTIQKYLDKLKLDPKQLYRLKLIYNKDGIYEISHFHYQPKRIQKIALVEIPTILYSYKYTNRTCFEELYKNFDADEFIITKDGYLTDTTIANIALLKQKQWYTPKEPLLYGTTRARYLQNKKLLTKDIHYNSLENYSNIALLNAMIDFKIL